MDFLDGFLVNSLILKATSVEDVLFEKIERNKGTVRPYSTSQIKDILKNAKSKIRDDRIQLDATEVERQGDIEPQTTTSGNQVADKDGKPVRINDAHIMSALRQIQSNIPQDLFDKLLQLLQPSKPKQQTVPKMRKQEELVLERLVDSVEKGVKLSETLQNDMYDLGLLDIEFLLMLGDIAETGARNLHPNLYNRLMRLKERPEGMAPSGDYGGYEPTELFEKVMKELEQLSGLSRPNRKSIMREYELLRDQRKLTVVDLVRLVNQGKYRFQGQQTKQDFLRLSEKINETLNESWDKTIGRFIRDLEIKDDAGETTIQREWSSAKVEDELVSDWQRIKDNPDANFESLRGKKYLKEIYKLEEEYDRILNYFKAANALSAMLQEKTFISDDVSYDMTAKEKDFKEQYKNIKESITDYNKYRKTMIKEIKEKRKKQEQLRRRLQRKKMDDRPGAKPEQEDTAEVDEFMEQVAAERKKTEPTRITPGMNIDELRAKVKELNERYGK